MMKNELLPIRFCIIVDHSGVPPAPSRASARPLRLLPRASHAPYLPRLHRRPVPTLPPSAPSGTRCPIQRQREKNPERNIFQKSIFQICPQLVLGFLGMLWSRLSVLPRVLEDPCLASTTSYQAWCFLPSLKSFVCGNKTPSVPSSPATCHQCRARQTEVDL